MRSLVERDATVAAAAESHEPQAQPDLLPALSLDQRPELVASAGMLRFESCSHPRRLCRKRSVIQLGNMFHGGGDAIDVAEIVHVFAEPEAVELFTDPP